MQPKLPLSQPDIDDACARLAQGALANLDAEFERRNLLPILGEARVVLMAFFIHIGERTAANVFQVIADGHDYTALLPKPSKQEPPPSPL